MSFHARGAVRLPIRSLRITSLGILLCLTQCTRVRDHPQVHRQNPNLPDTIAATIIRLGANPNAYTRVVHWDSLSIRDGEIRIDSAVVLGNLDTLLVNGGIRCHHVIFLGRFDLSRSQFSRRVVLDSVIFAAPVHFDLAQFQDYTEFWFNKFLSTVDFGGAQFLRVGPTPPSLGLLPNPEFEGCSFSGGAAFGSTTFNRADFSGSSFNGSVLFTGAQFLGGAGFYHTTFSRRVDFINIFADGPIHIRWAQLHGRVSMQASDYQQFRDSFRNNGDRISEKSCAYDQRLYLMTNWQNWWSFSLGGGRDSQGRRGYGVGLRVNRNAADYLSYIFCGFGYRPERPVAWGLLFVLIFAVVYWDRDVVHPARAVSPGRTPSRISFRDALLFSVNTFTTVGYGSWEPSTKLLAHTSSHTRTFFSRILPPPLSAVVHVLGLPLTRLAGFVTRTLRITGRDLAALEGVLGWLILGLFIATLTNLWI